MVQFGENLTYILSPLAPLELLAAEYLRETNVSNFVYHLLLVTCSLDALKKSSKRKEIRIKKENVEVLQQTIYIKKKCYNKLYTLKRRQESKRYQDYEILGFD